MLLREGLFVTSKEMGPGRIQWQDDGQTLLIDGMYVSVEDISGLMGNACKAVEVKMESLGVDEAFRMSLLRELHELLPNDDPENDTAGHSFIKRKSSRTSETDSWPN
jgi:hypothetical protein